MKEIQASKIIGQFRFSEMCCRLS